MTGLQASNNEVEVVVDSEFTKQKVNSQDPLWINEFVCIQKKKDGLKGVHDDHHDQIEYGYRETAKIKLKMKKKAARQSGEQMCVKDEQKSNNKKKSIKDLWINENDEKLLHDRMDEWKDDEHIDGGRFWIWMKK